MSGEYADEVKEKQQILKEILLKEPTGSFYDLLYKFMARAKVKRQTAEGYIIAAIADNWMAITRNQNTPMKVFEILKALKYLKIDMQYQSKLEGEKRYNVETMSNEIIPKEEPPPEAAEELAKYRKLKEINELRKKMGLKLLDDLLN
ncbi:MAG: hypothetical protein ABSA74_03375 [Candidatus Staskawiczbacteria bacterium]